MIGEPIDRESMGGTSPGVAIPFETRSHDPLAENRRVLDRALAEGLLQSNGPRAILDLNMGNIEVTNNIYALARLVKIAIEEARGRASGTYLAILSLVTERSKLRDALGTSARVYWQRPHHALPNGDREGWISLKEYLIENGVNVDEMETRAQTPRAEM